MEIWKDIPGHKYFQVSNTSRVKRLPYSFERGKGEIVHMPERELKTSINVKGYLRVELCFGGKKYPYTVHRLVMYAFKGMPPEDMDQINHIDGNKLNNNPDNLEWSNNSLNIKHAWQLGLHKPRLPKSTNSPHAIILVHPETGIFYTIIEAAKLIDMNRSRLSLMMRNKIPNTTKFIMS